MSTPTTPTTSPSWLSVVKKLAKYPILLFLGWSKSQVERWQKGQGGDFGNGTSFEGPR